MNNDVKIPADLQRHIEPAALKNFTPAGHDIYIAALSKTIHTIQGLIGDIELDDRTYSAEQSLQPDFRRDFDAIRDVRKNEIGSLKERLTGLKEVLRLRREALITKTAEKTLEKAILVIAGQTTLGYLGFSVGSNLSRMEASLADIQKSLALMGEKKEGVQAAKTADEEKLIQLAARTAAYLEQLTVISEGLRKEEPSAKKTSWAAMFYHHYQNYLIEDGKVKGTLEFKQGDRLKTIWDAYLAADQKIKSLLASMKKEYNIPDDKTAVKQISGQFSDSDNLLSTIESLRQEVLFQEVLGSDKAQLSKKFEDLKCRVNEHNKKVKERAAHIDHSIQAYACWNKAMGDAFDSATRKLGRLEKEALSMNGWAMPPAKLTPAAKSE